MATLDEEDIRNLATELLRQKGQPRPEPEPEPEPPPRPPQPSVLWQPGQPMNRVMGTPADLEENAFGDLWARGCTKVEIKPDQDARRGVFIRYTVTRHDNAQAKVELHPAEGMVGVCDELGDAIDRTPPHGIFQNPMDPTTQPQKLDGDEMNRRREEMYQRIQQRGG